MNKNLMINPYRLGEGQIYNDELGFEVDSNIADLLMYLHKNECRTRQSCGHLGEIDIVPSDYEFFISAMDKLSLPEDSWWMSKVYIRYKHPAHYYTLHIAKCDISMWDRVQQISDIARGDEQ